MIWYCGSRNSCDGTISTDRNARTGSPCPGTRSRREREAGGRAEQHLPGGPSSVIIDAVAELGGERKRLEDVGCSCCR